MPLLHQEGKPKARIASFSQYLSASLIAVLCVGLDMYVTWSWREAGYSLNGPTFWHIAGNYSGLLISLGLILLALKVRFSSNKGISHLASLLFAVAIGCSLLNFAFRDNKNVFLGGISARFESNNELERLEALTVRKESTEQFFREQVFDRVAGVYFSNGGDCTIELGGGMLHWGLVKLPNSTPSETAQFQYRKLKKHWYAYIEK